MVIQLSAGNRTCCLFVSNNANFDSTLLILVIDRDGINMIGMLKVFAGKLEKLLLLSLKSPRVQILPPPLDYITIGL